MGNLTITINTDNEAFGGKIAGSVELSRLLTDLAKKVEAGNVRDGLRLLDINGNAVGSLTMDEAQVATKISDAPVSEAQEMYNVRVPDTHVNVDFRAKDMQDAHEKAKKIVRGLGCSGDRMDVARKPIQPTHEAIAEAGTGLTPRELSDVRQALAHAASHGLAKTPEQQRDLEGAIEFFKSWDGASHLAAEPVDMHAGDHDAVLGNETYEAIAKATQEFHKYGR